MEQANPIIITLMFVARCLIPLLIMLGLSYLFKRLGLIQEPPAPPDDQDQNGDTSRPGGLMHGKV